MAKTKGVADALDKLAGRNLKKIRQAQALSQSQIAKQLNITFQQIQKYERGTNRISAGNLYKLAVIFDTGLDSFFAIDKQYEEDARNGYTLPEALTHQP